MKLTKGSGFASQEISLIKRALLSKKNYEDLENKPKIDGVELTKNSTKSALDIASATSLEALEDEFVARVPEKVFYGDDIVLPVLDHDFDLSTLDDTNSLNLSGCLDFQIVYTFSESGPLKVGIKRISSTDNKFNASNARNHPADSKSYAIFKKSLFRIGPGESETSPPASGNYSILYNDSFDFKNTLLYFIQSDSTTSKGNVTILGNKSYQTKYQTQTITKKQTKKRSKTK